MKYLVLTILFLSQNGWSLTPPYPQYYSKAKLAQMEKLSPSIETMKKAMMSSHRPQPFPKPQNMSEDDIPVKNTAVLVQKKRNFTAGISDEEGIKTINKINGIFKNAKIMIDYEDFGFMARAYRSGVIKISIGTMRNPNMTKDILTLIACREIGHLYGGAPMAKNQQWSSAEGQADYFATLKCTRKIWSDEDNSRIEEQIKIRPYVRSKCNKAYPHSGKDFFMCMRSGMTGLSLIQLENQHSHVSLDAESRDKTIVSEINLAMPGPQCRVDTFFNGALCDKPISEKLDQKDFEFSTCLSRKEEMGARPRCWFSPFN